MSIYQVKNKSSGSTQPTLTNQVGYEITKIQENVLKKAFNIPKIFKNFNSWIKKKYSAYNQERMSNLIQRKNFNSELEGKYPNL